MQRRKFLQLGSTAAGMLAINSVLPNSFLSGCMTGDEKRMKTFGIQLWTVRDALAKDPKGVLKQLAESGYSHVESFEGAQGIFWGMKHTEFKQYIGDLAITIHSAHCNVGADFERKAAEAAEIGMKYLIMPWEGPGKTL